MDLLWVNEINSAISKMPPTYRSNLVVGDFNFFRKVTGRSFKKHELKNYGVSMQIDGFDANILTLSEKIAYQKQLDVFGRPRQLPSYNVVGINTTKYSVPKKMTERKAIINKAYKEKTGNNWGFNRKGETTVHHEFGHVVHNGLYGQLSSEWDSIAKTWAKKENYDLLNVQTSWTESYGEAFAEAWGAYHSENKKRLPENVIKFIEKVL
jgi:hypothetical protein